MKILGFVLLVAGIIAAWASWSFSYGTVAIIISVIVAAVGLWLAVKKDGGDMAM